MRTEGENTAPCDSASVEHAIPWDRVLDPGGNGDRGVVVRCEEVQRGARHSPRASRSSGPRRSREPRSSSERVVARHEPRSSSERGASSLAGAEAQLGAASSDAGPRSRGTIRHVTNGAAQFPAVAGAARGKQRSHASQERKPRRRSGRLTPHGAASHA